MGSVEVKYALIAATGFAMSLIGFVTVWVKIGLGKGKQEAALKTLEEKTAKNEKDIADIRSETKGIQIEIARHLGAVEAKLDYIKEIVAALKGGRRAAEK